MVTEIMSYMGENEKTIIKIFCLNMCQKFQLMLPKAV